MAAKPLTKSQFLDELSTRLDLSKKDAKELMETLVDFIYQETKQKGELTIPGLGKLQKKHRKARMGVNPATGEKIKIGAKTVIKFRVAKAAKDAIL